MIKTFQKSKYNSRKLLLFVGCIVWFSILLLANALESSDFASIMLIILPAYFIANVGEHYVNKPK